MNKKIEDLLDEAMACGGIITERVIDLTEKELIEFTQELAARRLDRARSGIVYNPDTDSYQDMNILDKVHQDEIEAEHMKNQLLGKDPFDRKGY